MNQSISGTHLKIATAPARERLLFIGDVSEWTGIPVETLRYWRQLGRGPKSARLGGRVRYRESDVQAWIDAQFDGSSAAS